MVCRVFLVLVIASLAGCSYPVKITKASNTESLPSPVFWAVDQTTEDGRPVYTDIQVFERTGCKVPDCPLVWHVATNRKQGANEIEYGAFQGFGALYIVPAKTLRPGGKYELVLSEERQRRDAIQGIYQFEIDPAGKVIELPAREK